MVCDKQTEAGGRIGLFLDPDSGAQQWSRSVVSTANHSLDGCVDNNVGKPAKRWDQTVVSAPITHLDKVPIVTLDESS